MYRITDKEDVHFNGRKTRFKVFELQGSSYVFVGDGMVPGWGASDADCIAGYIGAQDEDYDENE